MWINICENKNIDPHSYVIKIHSFDSIPICLPRSHYQNKPNYNKYIDKAPHSYRPNGISLRRAPWLTKKTHAPIRSHIIGNTTLKAHIFSWKWVPSNNVFTSIQWGELTTRHKTVVGANLKEINLFNATMWTSFYNGTFHNP